MAGYLPPGCTQRECDMAQPGYWDDDSCDDLPPEEWVTCGACDGSGVIAHRVTVYEHGCGFSHDDTTEEPCGKCNGVGGWIDDAQPDR